MVWSFAKRDISPRNSVSLISSTNAKYVVGSENNPHPQIAQINADFLLYVFPGFQTHFSSAD
ncbi:MAG: hypothetical protein DME90_02730 [Verrucomicrobia bacterium]|nr:MAG: hypothetical protein DME90_02730 [Verrucomicrobiota bacterium]